MNRSVLKCYRLFCRSLQAHSITAQFKWLLYFLGVTILKAYLASFFSLLSFSLSAYDPYNCLADVSKIDQEIPIGLATELCSGAWSGEPAACYIGASLVDKEIPRFLAIKLCSGSIDAEKTIQCYAKSADFELNRGLAVSLCGVNGYNG